MITFVKKTLNPYIYIYIYIYAYEYGFSSRNDKNNTVRPERAKNNKCAKTMFYDLRLKNEAVIYYPPQALLLRELIRLCGPQQY